MRLSSLLVEVLGVQETVVEAAVLEDDVLLVWVRPRWRQRNRCGICGRKCKPYDTGRRGRRWRTLDLGTTVTYLVMDQKRVRCPRHGVVVAKVPWARHKARFTRQFEDQAAWLATHCSKKAVSDLLRVTWRSVGRIISRVVEESGSEEQRLQGLKRIGIDEISYRKGHRYLTVVVDHESGNLVWAAKGKTTAVVNQFFDALGEDGCRQIELVSRDAAEWIKGTVAKRCPQAVQCMDPFHVVQWATSAVERERRRTWQALRASGAPGAARDLKGTRWALLKNADSMNDADRRSLSLVQTVNRRLYRAYLLKEQLRMVFQAPAQDGEELLEAWLTWARRCRIPDMVAVAKAVTKERAGIVAALKHRVSNARIEATNTGIRLIARRAYGFHSADALIALALLKHGGQCPPLPGRGASSTQRA